MIASVEKNKLVYVLNRDSAANLTISSPLEAHRPQSITFALVGLDVGYENPIFAALEVDYSDGDQDPTGEAVSKIQKSLVYYELDLGLNHVVRRWSGKVERSAHHLVAVPGGTDGPSGVLVCSEGLITYVHMNKRQCVCHIPMRSGPYEGKNRSNLIIASIVQKVKGAFFFLLQNEDGDLFKVFLACDDDEVQTMYIKYFDSIPPATALAVLRQGFLFVASEYGNHILYRFEGLGDNDDEPQYSSAEYDPSSQMLFHPREYKNLSPSDELDSMGPLMGSQVANLTGEDAPQIYTISGRGPRSTLRILRHGLEVTEIVSSELPGFALAVWTLRYRADDEYDKLIVLSFSNGTLVLSVGETVEEVSDTGILASLPTIAVQQLGDDALIQIHARGIRHIQSDKQINEWKTPQHRTIIHATTNQRQVVIALSSGELVYFEIDDEGQLNEYEDRKQIPGAVTALSIAEVPEGRARTDFLAVGSDDSTVRIISLSPDNTLENLSLQALSAPASSLCIIPMQDGMSEYEKKTLYLHIGLSNGIYLRTVLDTIAGQLTDTRTRFLGSKPIKLFQVQAQGQNAVLALSSRSWLGFTRQAQLKLVPLSYDALEYGWNFSSENCAEGIVGIERNTLRIITIDRLSENLKQDKIPLSYTPRKLLSHPYKPIFYTLESDQQTTSEITKSKIQSSLQNGDLEQPNKYEFTHPRDSAGIWASCLRVVDPSSQSTIQKLEMDENEAAFSIAFVRFSAREDTMFLVVGSAVGASLASRSFSTAYLKVYSISDDGFTLTFLHKTPVDDIPLALIEFQGRLLAGIGGNLRIYEIGLKRLLRKCENRSCPNAIVSLHTQGSRIIAADVQESVFYIAYKATENKLITFADDPIAKFTTATTLVDYDTTAGGDKFGNLWIERCPQNISEMAEDEGSATQLLNERNYLNGAANKLSLLAHYHLGDIPTSLHKTQLVAGGRDILLFTGLSGSIGILVPFISREEVDFFQQLEALMRSEEPPIAGRDHMVYRGYYVPVKSVIDGDYCEVRM